MASVTIQWASPRPGPKLFRSRHIFKANKWGIACMLAIHETCSTINRQKLVQACRLSRITWWVKAASLHPNHVGRTTCGQVADACDANRQLGITKASDIYSCGEATQDPRPQEDSGKTRFWLFLILVLETDPNSWRKRSSIQRAQTAQTARIQNFERNIYHGS